MPQVIASTVTALVPAWQAAKFIQPTLDCLSAQTYENFQVIISVDKSTDDTFEICSQHASRDSRFKVIEHQNRLGYVGNCNFLLEQSDSDYVLFAFHDDILDADYISELASVLDERPEVVLSFSDTLLENVNGQQELWVYTQLEGLSNRVERAKLVLQGNDKWWVPNRGMFRLAQSRQVNGIKKTLAGVFKPDWPWLLHLSLLGEFARVPKTLCFKYYQVTSLSRNWGSSRWQSTAIRIALLREVLAAKISMNEKYQLTLHLLRTAYWQLCTRKK